MVSDDGVKLYSELYKWLTSISCGDCRKESSYKIYQKELWNPILDKLDELSKMNKSELSKNEEAFLNNVLYEGKIYRKMKYHSNRRGHIYEMPEYTSWSSNIEGIKNVPGLGGDILLLVGQTSRGINVQALIGYFYKFKTWEYWGDDKHIDKISRYFFENEIAAPILLKDIEDIKIIDLKDIDEWEVKGKSLDKSKWKRNKL